ncbi:hypothetical protein F5876DRAFT_65822 [Lentinula aff. lateritia]|uniref:Uncharacterized protein n=1 Tax=Lentinula aff. lateritia TaxID=2804960 RepID=A0ACC1U0H5_9AGAR|nr:hypothetical protein F5876DRAFT_65822 [Lentinula aff. lateritia]
MIECKADKEQNLGVTSSFKASTVESFFKIRRNQVGIHGSDMVDDVLRFRQDYIHLKEWPAMMCPRLLRVRRVIKKLFMSSFSKRQPASCQLQSLYMQHSLEFEFFNPPPPNLDPSQGMFTLMFLVLSSVSSFPRFWWGSLQALVDILEQLALAIVAKPSKCIVSESRRINRPSGPKIGTKGKRRSTFDQDRNISASDFQSGRTASLQSPEPIERSSTGVYSTMPDHSPDLVPHRISNSMHDHKHYAMVSNVASVSSSSPWYNYETQNYDNYGEYVEAGNSSGTDYWRMEGHGGNTQFNPSQELLLYPAYNTWDASVSFTQPQSYIADDDFQQRWNYSYSRNV